MFTLSSAFRIQVGKISNFDAWQRAEEKSRLFIFKTGVTTILNGKILHLSKLKLLADGHTKCDKKSKISLLNVIKLCGNKSTR